MSSPENPDLVWRLGRRVDLRSQPDPLLAWGDDCIRKARALAAQERESEAVNEIACALNLYRQAGGTPTEQAVAWCLLADIRQTHPLRRGEAANALEHAIALYAKAEAWTEHRAICLRLAAMQDERGLTERADSAREAAEKRMAVLPSHRDPQPPRTAVSSASAQSA